MWIDKQLNMEGLCTRWGAAVVVFGHTWCRLGAELIAGMAILVAVGSGGSVCTWEHSNSSRECLCSCRWPANNLLNAAKWHQKSYLNMACIRPTWICCQRPKQRLRELLGSQRFTSRTSVAPPRSTSKVLNRFYAAQVLLFIAVALRLPSNHVVFTL